MTHNVGRLEDADQHLLHDLEARAVHRLARAA
jgi:hypothetical protein